MPAGEGWAPEIHQVSFVDGPLPVGIVVPTPNLLPEPAFVSPAGAVPGVRCREVCVTLVLEGGLP